jgi:hypothetical protein
MSNKATEVTIAEQTLRVERKLLNIALKENHRGSFLRITEETGGKHSSVIIPSTGIADFCRSLQKVTDEFVRE